MKTLSAKLEKAKNLQEEIEKLEEKSSFLTKEEIAKEDVRTKEKLEGPLELIAKIEELEQSSDYLHQDQIQILRKTFFEI